MKVILPVSCLVALVLMGCSGGSSGSTQSTNNASASTQQTNSASDDNPLLAPVEYLGAMANAKQKAVKTADVSSLTRAIQMFQVGEGRFPKYLNELVEKQYIARIPEPPYGQKLVYNPATGQVGTAPAK